MDYGRTAEEPWASVRTVAAHLRNRRTGDLRHEATEEASGFAVLTLRLGGRDCGVHNRLCRDSFFWSTTMGLSGTVFEHQRDYEDRHQ